MYACEFLVLVLHPECSCPLGNSGKCMEIFSLIAARETPLASDGERPGTLVNILLPTGQFPQNWGLPRLKYQECWGRETWFKEKQSSICKFLKYLSNKAREDAVPRMSGRTIPVRVSSHKKTILVCVQHLESHDSCLWGRTSAIQNPSLKFDKETVKKHHA